MQTLTGPFPEPYATMLKRIGYRKRTVWVSTRRAGEPMRLRTYWDSGSRDQYMAFNSQGVAIAIPVSGAPMFTPDPVEWYPNPGDILVCYGTFQGKPATAHITIFQ